MNEAPRDISVLLVEDNFDDEWLSLWALKKIGVTNVSVAHDGLETLLMLHGKEMNYPPDIILLDLRLPKIDGLEVLRRIRDDDRTKDLNVVILSSSEDPRDKKTCQDLRVTVFLPKPLKMDDIIDLNIFFLQ